MYPSQYQALTTVGVKGMLLQALETGAAAWINDLVMRTNSDQASETYAWLGAPPAMHEFVGKRKLNELPEVSFSITNKDHEANLVFKSKDMRRDKLGQIQTRINQLADRVNDYPAALLSTLMLNGASSLCYDGQYFFDTDHAEGTSGTLSNSISADITTTTDPTSDEMAKAIMAAIQAMYGFKDGAGEPMNQNARAFTVMVPPVFMTAAFLAVSALLGATGQSAMIPALRDKFTINIEVNPRLNFTTKFMVFRTDGNVKPFILQEEAGGKDVIALGDGSEYEQMNKEQIFGVDYAGNVGYGYWQGAVLVTFT
jgi:phage major head subunit gpT-like protein